MSGPYPQVAPSTSQGEEALGASLGQRDSVGGACAPVTGVGGGTAVGMDIPPGSIAIADEVHATKATLARTSDGPRFSCMAPLL
jgi:hypothetical protein